MSTNIFIPTKIKVGYQSRKDTYTQKLAYVIYYDERNKLRKETSWESWRDKKIDSHDFENVPTTGFVLNKKVGDYKSDWNHRMAYVRVYDPRNFEFEITVDNLLYILENATSTKGKGLEGEFIYGWSGKDLVLIPCESPDYQELKVFNDIVHNKNYIKAKDLIIGARYKTKQNEELVYMGRFDYHNHYYKTNKGKHYFFAQESLRWDKSKYTSFVQMKSISGRIISVLDDRCDENYVNLMDDLEGKTCYSPYDETKDEFISISFEEFIEKCKKERWSKNFLSNHQDASLLYRSNYTSIQLYTDASTENVVKRKLKNTSYYSRDQYETLTYEEAYERYKPFKVKQYLANGKFYQEVE